MREEWRALGRRDLPLFSHRVFARCFRIFRERVARKYFLNNLSYCHRIRSTGTRPRLPHDRLTQHTVTSIKGVTGLGDVIDSQRVCTATPACAELRNATARRVAGLILSRAVRQTPTRRNDSAGDAHAVLIRYGDVCHDTHSTVSQDLGRKRNAGGAQ